MASNNEEHEKVEKYKVSLFANLHACYCCAKFEVIKGIVSVVRVKYSILYAVVKL